MGARPWVVEAIRLRGVIGGHVKQWWLHNSVVGWARQAAEKDTAGYAGGMTPSEVLA
jgi:hypothetical protein